MKNYRSIFRSFACALAFAFSSFGWASPLESVRYAGAFGWYDSYAHADAKFKAELAYHAQLPSGSMVAVNSDLRRDSHGYRQSAADEFEISAPTDH
jgi:hypothetical protein